MHNRSCGLLLVSLPPHPSFFFPFLVFASWRLFEVFLPHRLVCSIVSLGPGPPLFVCSGSVGSLCSSTLCWRLLLLPPVKKSVCVCLHGFMCTAFLQSLFNHMKPPFCILCGQASVSKTCFEMQPERSYIRTTEDRDTAFSWLSKI